MNTHGITIDKITKISKISATLSMSLFLLAYAQRMPCPVIPDYMLFSSMCGTFCKRGHLMDHRIKINTYLKIEIIQHTYPAYNRIEQVNSNKMPRQPSSIWESNNILLNNLWVKGEITREIGKYFELNNNNKNSNNKDMSKMGHLAKAVPMGKLQFLMFCEKIKIVKTTHLALRS